MSDELIAALKEQTKSNVLLAKAIMGQTDVISQLVNAVALLIDSTELPEPTDDAGQPVYLMDGTRVS
jgi:hypothetical protein